MPSNFPIRILIVDDNQDGAELLSELVSEQGYATCTAYDGFMALEAALAFHPHIVILDLGMPRFSGDEVAPMLRQLRKFEDVYIIALTGRHDSEARALTRRAGFDLHLAKPVQLPELFAALELGSQRRPAPTAGGADAPLLSTVS
ncbi:response regulator [Massilia sp. YIM B02763]|uniref:response regulator n=1 Tax=Massilia sp. YIM B02763 TaxID=3050130 RepID=UPI0025B71CAD|nr:response regulator [Massilia sp. YIM B02763]MDN4051997.1 response regulator [Massilia sp. YIM B02763]